MTNVRSPALPYTPLTVYWPFGVRACLAGPCGTGTDPSTPPVLVFAAMIRALLPDPQTVTKYCGTLPSAVAAGEPAGTTGPPHAGATRAGIASDEAATAGH